MASIRSIRFLALSSIALATTLICGSAMAGTSHPNLIVQALIRNQAT